jgi:hypothetical protein
MQPSSDMTRWLRFTRVLLTLAVVGCGVSTSSPHSGRVTVDTLPDGTVRTMSSAPTEAGQWALIEERRIAGPELEVGMVRDLALHPDGSLYVADLDPVTVHVFAPDGHALATIGRLGSGPGEFADAFLALQGDTVVVQDRRASRVTRFDRAGRTIDFLASACCATEGIGLTRAGGVLVPVPGAAAGAKRWLIAGASDTITFSDPRLAAPTLWNVQLPGGGGFGKLVPLVPTMRFGFDPLGTVMAAWSGEYLLMPIGRDGTRRSFGRVITDRPRLDDGARAALAREMARTDASLEQIPIEILTSAYDPSLLPSEPELFDWIWADPAGRTWVQRVVPGSDSVQLDLFDRSGVLLDEVRLPRAGWPTHPHSRPVSWTAERVAVAVEGDLGTEIIVYRIERGTT